MSQRKIFSSYPTKYLKSVKQPDLAGLGKNHNRIEDLSFAELDEIGNGFDAVSRTFDEVRRALLDKIGRMISLRQMGAEDAEPIYKKIEEIKSLTEFLIANISSDALTQDTVLQKRNLLVQIQNAVKNLTDFLDREYAANSPWGWGDVKRDFQLVLQDILNIQRKTDRFAATE